MLDDTDYDDILQKISLMFLPDVSNLNELVIRKNKKTTSYKGADILLAYNMLCSGKDIKNNKDKQNHAYRSRKHRQYNKCFSR